MHERKRFVCKPEDMEAAPVGTAPSSSAARWAPSANPGRRSSLLNNLLQHNTSQLFKILPGCSCCALPSSLFVRGKTRADQRKRSKSLQLRLLFVGPAPDATNSNLTPFPLLTSFLCVGIQRCDCDRSGGVTSSLWPATCLEGKWNYYSLFFTPFFSFKWGLSLTTILYLSNHLTIIFLDEQELLLHHRVW